MPPRHLAFALCLAAAGAAPAFANQHAVPGGQFLTAWDLDADGAATLSELEEMRGTVFDMFDADENGVLDAGEYEAFDETRAADMENHAAGGQGGRMLQRVADGLGLVPNDADGDGAVTRAEFIAGTAAWLAEIDRTGDGVVTTDDFGR